MATMQESLKRMVGYLIVAETGFLLIGLLVLDKIAVAALLYNLVIELFALCGIFYILSFFAGVVRGMLRSAPFEGVCFVVFFLCLVGAPGLPGFLGKFTLIGAAVHHKRFAIAGFAILTMLLGHAAVAKLSYQMIGDGGVALAPSRSRIGVLLCLLVPLILLTLFSDTLLLFASRSLGFLGGAEILM